MPDSINVSQHDRNRDFAAGLALASLDLYHRNAFRVLEVSVEATDRDIARRRDLMERASRNQLQVPPGPSRILPEYAIVPEFELQDQTGNLQTRRCDRPRRNRAIDR